MIADSIDVTKLTEADLRSIPLDKGGYEKLKKIEQLLTNEAATYGLRQEAAKISLNSLYGVIGNQYFRLYDLDNAEAVTLTGQLIIQWIARAIDVEMNRILKTEGKRYVLYCDTDSVYIHVEKVLEGMLKSTKKPIPEDPSALAQFKTDLLDKFCRDHMENFINNTFRDMTAKVLNGCGDYLRMKREVIADQALWTAKKRYILNVYDDEGIRHKEAEIKKVGVEIAKASAPQFCRDAMLEAVKMLMKGDKQGIYDLTERTRAKFYELSPEDIAFPRSVNPDGYADADTVWSKGAPLPVKGALVYNHLVKTLGLSNKYQLIKQGEKIKYLYLKEPNPTRDRVISFLNILPREFGLHEYIDLATQFEKSYIEPLNLILTPIGWSAEPRASLDAFWI